MSDKLCKDCEFSYENSIGLYMCTRPKFRETYDLQRGRGHQTIREDYIICMFERAVGLKHDPDRCGPEGKYWEPKKPWVPLSTRFKNLLKSWGLLK